MNKLDDRGEYMVQLPLVAMRARRQQHQQWTEAFTAGVYDVVPELVYQRHIRLQALADNAVHLGHIIMAQGVDFIRTEQYFGH